jgi:hypothetical protein
LPPDSSWVILVAPEQDKSPDGRGPRLRWGMV